MYTNVMEYDFFSSILFFVQNQQYKCAVPQSTCHILIVTCNLNKPNCYPLLLNLLSPVTSIKKSIQSF